MTHRFLGLAAPKIEGVFGRFDTSWGPSPTKEERAEVEREWSRRYAGFTEFAKTWARTLNEDRGYYEVSHEVLIEDIMRIEAALREELTRG